MYTQESIYNLALSALLLGKEVTEVSTDKSNEVRVLNIHWNTALGSALKDLDLDILSSPVTLELIAELENGPWSFVYKYPTNCALLRRIQSPVLIDTSRTHIPKRVGVHENVKAIFTNEYNAIAEIVPRNVSLALLNENAAMAIAYKLAWLSAPLITGKGAARLRQELHQMYLIAKSEAQEDDKRENFNYDADEVRSEFVAERLS